VIEKAEHERSIDRKQQKIKELLADVRTLYQVSHWFKFIYQIKKLL
jgi:uncharacterized membrane protein